MSTNQLNDLSKVYLAQIAEETPAERIDRISQANVAKRKAKADADKSARDKKTAEFQKHKQSVLAKGGRPVDALDSWHKKQAHKEAYSLVEQSAAEKKRETLNKIKKDAQDILKQDDIHRKIENEEFKPLTPEKKKAIKNQAERRHKSANRAQMASDYKTSTKQDQQVRNMKRVSESRLDKDPPSQFEKGDDDRGNPAYMKTSSMKDEEKWERLQNMRRKSKKASVRMKAESFSNWRDDLFEIVAEPEEKAEKEVTEKKVKNKIIINPTFQESINEIGGEVLDAVEIEEEDKDLKKRAQFHASRKEFKAYQQKKELKYWKTKKKNPVKAPNQQLKGFSNYVEGLEVSAEEVLDEVKVTRLDDKKKKEDKDKKVKAMLARQAEWESGKKKALHASHEPEGESLDEKDSYKTVAAVIDYDRAKKGSEDATYDSDHGKKKQAKKERDYAAWERSKMKRDDPNWKHKKYHTGMHGESVEADEYIEVVGKVKKSELEADLKRWGFEAVDEAVKGQDTQDRKDAAADRRAGKDKLLSKKTGESYAKWTMRKHPASVDEDKKYGYDKDGNSLNPADIEKKKRKEDDLFGSPNSKKKASVEEQSNPGDTRPQSPTENKKDPALESKKKKAEQLKKQVLMRKLQAVRAGGGGEITASYEPDVEGAVEYFYEEGINEDGLQLIIEEVGLEDLVDFVEERSARKMNVRTKGSIKKQVEKDAAAEAKRREQKKGEYAETPKKKPKVGLSYATKVKPAAKKPAPKPAPKPVAKKDYDGDGKKETPKQEHRGVRNKKIAKAVAKAKPAQPKKEVSKGGLRDKLKSAYKAGVKRHRKATQPARIFHKGLKSGARTAVKAAKDVKKAVVGEEIETEGWKPDPVEKRKKKAADLHRRETIASATPAKYKTDKTEDPDKLYKRRMAVDSKSKMRKEEYVDEAKVDAGKTPHEKETARNKRNTPAGGNPKFDRSVFITRKSGESLDSARGRKRREAHSKRRGVSGAPVAQWKGSKDKVVREEIISEKDLNAKERRALPDSDFALPGKGEGPQGKQAGSYPIPDKKHARSALSLVSQHGTPEEKAKVRAKVAKKFPGIQQEEVKDKQGLDKYDRHKRMIRHKQDKYGRNVIGADYNLENERKAKGWKKKLNKEDKAFDNVVSMLRKKHGESGVLTKDSPKPKAQPQSKKKPEKDTRSSAQREVDAQYGRTPWNKKGSLGT